MPIASLFWCAGCQGSIYPMGGHVATHRRRAGLDADHPAHDREDAPAAGDLHRRRVGGKLCGYYPLPIMDKTH